MKLHVVMLKICYLGFLRVINDIHYYSKFIYFIDGINHDSNVIEELESIKKALVATMDGGFVLILVLFTYHFYK